MLTSGDVASISGGDADLMTITYNTNGGSNFTYTVIAGGPLTLVGASDNQIEAVSFGKEKPAVEGTSEEAYAKNRRVEFRYQ